MLRSRAMIPTVAGALLVLALTSCTAEPMPVPSVTPTATEAPTGDGVLRIGSLLPTTGATAFIAPAQVAGVELAVKEINEAGGVGGAPVEVFHRDSGDASTGKAETSLAELLEKEVDVIVGPSSSVLAERLLPTVIEAGVAMISPAATDPAISVLDDEGYLFRTIPSAALQGVALAEVAGKGKDVAVVYFDDVAGVAVAETLGEALDAVDGELVASEKFTRSTDVAKLIAAVTDAEPDIVVFVSPFSELAKNKTIITALAKAKLAGAKLWLTSQSLHDYSQALPAGLMKDVQGILEGAEPDDAFKKRIKSADPAVKDYRYAAEAYDATILAALAAIVAGDDSGDAVARTLRDVSNGGIKCMSFGECLDVLKTRTDIDYDGVSGPLGLDEAGDPHPAHYGLYKYNAENKYARVDGVLVG